MGSKISKTSTIDYRNIHSIVDIKIDKLPNRHDHIITYENGEQVSVSFTSKKEYRFRTRHNFAMLYKPICVISFIDIERIENYIEYNKQQTYSFSIIYKNKEPQKFMINKHQHELFWKLFKVMNSHKCIEIKASINYESFS